MKTILFPTDFSAAAENAFIYALKVADTIGASITTLHVYEVPSIRGARMPMLLKEIYESINLEEFEDYRDSIPVLHEIAERNNMAHVSMNHVMERGETISTILKVANKDAVDMIILGTTGATGLKEIFVGSVAGAVLERANCPVLGVPINAMFDGVINKMAMTISFQEEEETALRTTLTLAALFGSEVHCIHADLTHTESYAGRMQVLKTKFEGVPKLYFNVLESINLESTIATFLDKNQIDILVMVTHPRKGFLKKIFDYSITKRMVYHLDTPVLAIPV